jgi:hypothetical protein
MPRGLIIKYYTNNTGPTTKNIDFMINLSKLNNMFPSLVEYNFLESNFDNRININFNILNNVNNDLEKARIIAKNYYLVSQVLLRTSIFTYDGLMLRINKFLKGLNK